MLIPSIRKITNTNSPKVIGLFFSHKMKEYCQYESTLERDWLLNLEYRRDILTMKCQTILKYKDGLGKVRQYTPDVCTNQTHFVLPVFYEVKPLAIVESTGFAEERRRYEVAIHQNGGALRVVTEREIRLEPRLASLKLLYPYAKLPPLTAVERLAIQRSVCDPQNVTINDLVVAGRQFNLGLPQLRREIFRGCLNVDLELPLSGNSRVLFRENDHE